MLCDNKFGRKNKSNSNSILSSEAVLQYSRAVARAQENESGKMEGGGGF